jgi:CRISPR-associated protein Csm3
MKLKETKIVSGTITLETGLHIGGSKSSLDIGGLDLPVIKTPQGVPYIPGSSLKGKIRSLLGIKDGSISVENDRDLLKKMFGFPGVQDKIDKNKVIDAKIARLIFRDAILNKDDFIKVFPKDAAILDTEYTEAKWENKIDRKSGKADGGLRQIERVPAGAKFNFEVVVNIFDEDKEDIVGKLKEGFELLENNYLGGSGSRGYGKVKIIYKEQ